MKTVRHAERPVKVEDLVVVPGFGTVYEGGRHVMTLARRQAYIFAYLAACDREVTANELLTEAWEPSLYAMPATVIRHALALGEKLGPGAITMTSSDILGECSFRLMVNAGSERPELE